MVAWWALHGEGREPRVPRPAASIALARGIHPKIVQEMLGHSGIAITLDLYSHVVPSLQREAAREMGIDGVRFEGRARLEGEMRERGIVWE